MSKPKTKQWIIDCVRYWETRIDETDLGVDFAEAHERCWRCGLKTKYLQKCHIIPKSLKGKDTPDNTIPLCCFCHDHMPDVRGNSEVWRWIKHTLEDFPLARFYNIELRPLMGLKMSGIDLLDLAVDEADLFLRQCERYVRHSSSHFNQSHGGQGIKPETWSWIFRKSYAKVLKARLK